MKFLFPCVTLFLIALWMGCDTNDPGLDDGVITEIRMEPDSVALEPGEEVDFSIVAVTSNGDVVEDHGLDIRWWSRDTTVFDVTDGGHVTPRGEGSAWCLAESEGFAKSMFVGRDSAWVTVLF